MSLPSHELDLDLRGGVLVATVSGEIDLANVAAIEAGILDAARRDGASAVVLDISLVSYLDSAAFAAVHRMTAVSPVRLVLAPSSTVYRAVMVAGLDRMAPTYDTVDDALRSVEA